MRDREGGPRGEQLARSDQQDQTQHEEQMIEPEQDVFHPDPEIGEYWRPLWSAQLNRAGAGAQHG